MYRLIVGMSEERETVMNRCRSFSATITDHICKIIVFSNIRPENIDHWTHEIAKDIWRCSKLRVKPRNRKLKYQQYKDTIFGWFGDSRDDAKLNLEDCFEKHCIRDKHDPYPEFDIDEKLINKTHQCCMEISDVFSEMLSSKSEESLNDIEEILKNILRKYITNY